MFLSKIGNKQELVDLFSQYLVHNCFPEETKTPVVLKITETHLKWLNKMRKGFA